MKNKERPRKVLIINWWALLISGISVILSVTSLVYSYNLRLMTVEKNHFEQEIYRISKIENEVKALGSDLWKENSDLKGKLYKAEMLISVYEKK